MLAIDALGKVGPGEPRARALEDVGVTAGVFPESPFVFPRKVDDGVDGQEGRELAFQGGV